MQLQNNIIDPASHTVCLWFGSLWHSNFSLLVVVAHMLLPLLVIPFTFILIPDAKMTDDLASQLTVLAARSISPRLPRSLFHNSSLVHVVTALFSSFTLVRMPASYSMFSPFATTNPLLRRQLRRILTQSAASYTGIILQAHSSPRCQQNVHANDMATAIFRRLENRDGSCSSEEEEGETLELRVRTSEDLT